MSEQGEGFAAARRRAAILAAAVATACGSTGQLRPTSTFVDGASGRLLVNDGGSGRGVPVVLIHSLAGNSGQWAPQLAHLRETRRAVAIDSRGHGGSDVPADGRYGLRDHAEDLRRVMDSREIRRAVVVGHSFGGGVAIALANLVPDRVAGIFFVDPIDDPSKRPADGASEAFLQRLEGPEYSAVIEAYW